MTIIDSRVHAYQANTPKRPWQGVPNWPDHVTGDEMVAAMVVQQVSMARNACVLLRQHRLRHPKTITAICF